MQIRSTHLGAGLAGSLLTLMVLIACGSDAPGNDDDVAHDDDDSLPLADDDLSDDDDVVGDDDTEPVEDNTGVLACEQWEVTLVRTNADLEGGETLTLDAAWEPFSAFKSSGDNYFYVRHCLSTQ